MEILLVAASALLAAMSAAVLGEALRRRLGFVVEVESGSMLPTLTPGRRLPARRLPDKDVIGRGDVVVVDSVELERAVVKRVVGLPGEHVVVDAAGRVRIDGRPLDEPYVAHHGGRPMRADVPVGHLLLLGDNRARSSDARTWIEPFVPVSAVLGRVVLSGTRSPAAAPGRGSRQRHVGPGGSRLRAAAR